MPRPTSVSAAVGAIDPRPQSAERSRSSAASTSGVAGCSRRVERDGDVGLRGRDRVDRQAVAGEAREGLGEEAHLLPHAQVSMDTRVMPLRAQDRLDRRRRVSGAGGRDHRARQVGPVRVSARGAGCAWRAGRDAARVEHLGAGGWRSPAPRRSRGRAAGGPRGCSAGLAVNMPGTSVQISHRAAPQPGGEVGGRGVRAAAAEEHGLPSAVAGDEALGDDHAPLARSQAAAQLIGSRS